MTLALLLRYWHFAVIGLLVAALGVQTYRIGNLKHALDKANGRAEAYKSAYADSEAARGQEQAQATTSYDTLNKRCLTNYEEALKRGQTIQTIVNRPPPASGRGIITAGELQQLIGQATGG